VLSKGIEVIFGILLLAIASTPVSSSRVGDGVIDGIVVNATRDHMPMGGTEVALRIRVDGQFVGVARTTSQPDGRFRFENLPTGAADPYLPGANKDDVHFPGPRVWLTAEQPHAQVTLTVFDSVSDPNPLVIQRQEIVIHPEPGMLRVTESILIDNPSERCYVGRPPHDGGAPVTLRLAIPADFDRVTFDKEALGRQFVLVDGRLVTGIPWPPGKRELVFSYVIANEKSRRVWERPIDLPCSHVSLCVQTNDPANVVCNLPRAGTTEKEEECFESKGHVLPAGQVVRLELGHLPVPRIVYARWTALLILATLIVGVSLISMYRWQKEKSHPSVPRRPARYQHQVEPNTSVIKAKRRLRRAGPRRAA
jgi:hypothetical protein